MRFCRRADVARLRAGLLMGLLATGCSLLGSTGRSGTSAPDDLPPCVSKQHVLAARLDSTNVLFDRDPARALRCYQEITQAAAHLADSIGAWADSVYGPTSHRTLFHGSRVYDLDEVIRCANQVAESAHANLAAARRVLMQRQYAALEDELRGAKEAHRRGDYTQAMTLYESVRERAIAAADSVAAASPADTALAQVYRDRAQAYRGLAQTAAEDLAITERNSLVAVHNALVRELEEANHQLDRGDSFAAVARYRSIVRTADLLLAGTEPMKDEKGLELRQRVLEIRSLAEGNQRAARSRIHDLLAQWVRAAAREAPSGKPREELDRVISTADSLLSLPDLEDDLRQNLWQLRRAAQLLMDSTRR
jgi:hypothetical protein